MWRLAICVWVLTTFEFRVRSHITILTQKKLFLLSGVNRRIQRAYLVHITSISIAVTQCFRTILWSQLEESKIKVGLLRSLIYFFNLRCVVWHNKILSTALQYLHIGCHRNCSPLGWEIGAHIPSLWLIWWISTAMVPWVLRLSAIMWSLIDHGSHVFCTLECLYYSSRLEID